MNQIWRVLCVIVVLLLTSGQTHAEPPKPESEGEASSYPVLVGDEEVFSVEVGLHGRSAAQRAADANKKLEHALERGATDVRLKGGTSTILIYVGARPVIELGEEDAVKEERPSLQALADEVASRLRESFSQEKHRKEIAERVLGISGIVFFGLITVLLFRLIGRWAKRASRWAAREGRGVGAVRIHTVEVLPAAAASEALRLSIVGGSWLLRVGLVYTWFLAVLSLFAVTRPFVGKATGYLFTPALSLVGRLASRLPLVFAIFLALLAVLLVVRFITVYAVAIEKREIESEWLRPETARTTGSLLVVATCLSALLFVTPLLAGTADGSLSRVGVLGLGAIALGATPYIASCVLGIRAVYGGSFGLSDQIEYGGQRGKVLAISLFDVSLLSDEGGEVRVPHLMSLWTATKILTRATPSLTPSEDE